jgi:hypothetical protein
VSMRTLIRTVSVALLGAAAALLVSCGSSGKGLIPSANAGPLQSDFEAVARAATSGNGDCGPTESALGKTEQDFLALPASIDRGLHLRLEQGISNLRKRALAMCIQPTSTATATGTETTPSTTTSTETTPTTTPTATTTTPTATSTQTTPTTTAPQGQEQGGGTLAPGESEEGQAKDKGKSEGEGIGAAGPGGASAGGGQ